MTESTSTLIKSIKIEEDFETGAKNLSAFFRRSEERWDAGDVLDGLFSSGDVHPKILEYALFCFLHVGRSDIDTAAAAMPLRSLTRLLLRALRSPRSLSEREFATVARMRAEARLQNMAHFQQIRADAQTWIDALFARKALHHGQNHLLSLLVECEAASLAERLNRVSDWIDPYDLKAMAKILPLVTIYEERARSYRQLAETVRAGGEIGKSIVSFEYFMKEDDFAKWLKRVSQKERLRRFHDTILRQREKKIPTRALVGICSITRCALGGDTGKSAPLDWISNALAASGGSRFAVECNDAAREVEKLLGGSTIRLTGTSAHGDYNKESFAGVTGADMLTTPADRPDPDPYDLACRLINNDAILMRLLDNPQAYGRPGLVEYVAKASRSPAVLTKIASTRELYATGATQGVPAALLRSPCAIPMSMLRGFVNPRYVSTSDMREIIRYGHSVRREVLSEIEGYMNRR